jgi:hypothetical protein
MLELTQQSGSLTRLASDLGRTHHKYHLTVQMYLYISRRLTTVFPNNAAEQEKYYLSNVLK